MRLLVVSQYFWPENFRINELVAEWVARGHEVTVLTGRPNYPEGEIFPAYRDDPSAFESYCGAQVVRVPMRPRGKGSVRLALNYLSFAFWGTVLGPFKLRGRQFDAIFVFQTSPVTAALPALLLRWIKRAPLAMWVLDLWPDTLSAVGVVRSPRVLGWVGALVRFIYRRCDRILVQSRAFFPGIERWLGDVVRVRYFPGWAEGIFDGSLSAVVPAPELAPHGHTFNVMFAGNMGDAQDFPAILAAAEQLRHRDDVRWLIVGDGRAADALRAEILRRELTASVVLLGRHALERMPEFFRGAGALLVSLKRDPVFAMTIPGKVQTYMAAGVPILGMLDGEGARVIEESGGGWVCAAGDSAGLAANVAALADLSSAKRAAMGERGRAYGMREFDRATLMDRLETLLNEMTGKPVQGHQKL
ncbi:MAG: glycosyltransferase family 4 protein [Burkholderiaceae bacterium]|nr:glycosyltransferase family 4 protein [Burkholderiaceae bacterium]MDZ4143664.1 glycosyltransferase family 4 protein [Burkholderiales bacterium]